ncbi:MAG: hypothetical protein JKY55_18675 [Aliivibrio sp.]|uniref:hypothetical protein n=1 Tax=Aliivibrio sp. TaxID=1872443 RepID=UPI001A605B0D|nr:hypothetical protein [Aliivibrio sp.]
MGAEPIRANACVGDNGQPNYIHYAKGFSAASNMLLEKVLSEDPDAYVDELIYPICFNMRHSVELRLKGAIEELIELSNFRDKNLSFDTSKSHDIDNIWSFFKVNAPEFDERYQEVILSMNQTISDIADVDATGQTFRYPFGKESQKHLVDIGGVISCRVLWIKFRELEQNLDKLHKLSKFLLREYGLGSFTSKLSRVQLFSLAMDLPNYREWKEPDFKQTKSQLKNKYNLSSNDLTKAVNKIKNTYEMAHYISLEKELLGLTQEQLYVFIEQWIICDSGSAVTWRNKAYETVSDSISTEYLAGLNAIFYFSGDLEFCEYYSSTYELELRMAASVIDNEVDAKMNFMHILCKRNFMENLLKSLYFLHFNELADSIVSKYNLTDGYEFIPYARSRELFELPSFSGY